MTAVAADPYAKAVIKRHLDQVDHGTLSSLDGERITSRFMVFACEPELDRFYLLTDGRTEKISQLERNATASLAVLTPAETLDDYAETAVRGTVRRFERFEDGAVRHALPLLAAKSPVLEGLIASEDLGPYVLLQLDAEDVTFRIYQDVVSNAPKTVYRFGHA